MNCGCVVVLYCGGGGGGAGGDDDRDCRGARVTRYRGLDRRRRVPVARRRRRRADESRAGASMYLGPGAADACRSASTAAGCPGSPCPTCPPRSCNRGAGKRERRG